MVVNHILSITGKYYRSKRAALACKLVVSTGCGARSATLVHCHPTGATSAGDRTYRATPRLFDRQAGGGADSMGASGHQCRA